MGTGGIEAEQRDGFLLGRACFGGLISKLRALRQPVIAAVSGVASGGGLVLALGAEMRHAATSARFTTGGLQRAAAALVVRKRSKA